MKDVELEATDRDAMFPCGHSDLLWKVWFCYCITHLELVQIRAN